jgi:hypothetical protein
VRICFLLALLSFTALTLAAADKPSESWDNLQRLKSGQNIEVIDAKLKSHKGQFTAFDPAGLTLKTEAGPLTLPRADVFRVSLREHSKRWRNAAIGAAIGAGTGLAIGAPLDYRFSNEGREHIAKTLFIPIGAGAGAAIGSSFAGFETIYRAPKK